MEWRQKKFTTLKRNLKLKKPYEMVPPSCHVYATQDEEIFPSSCKSCKQAQTIFLKCLKVRGHNEIPETTPFWLAEMWVLRCHLPHHFEIAYEDQVRCFCLGRQIRDSLLKEPIPHWCSPDPYDLPTPLFD